MGTNLTLNKEEIELMLITVLKIRNVLFDCVEMKFDRNSLKEAVKNHPRWKGKRGTIPLLEDVDKMLALIRLHINSEETIAFYEALGLFDKPRKLKNNKPN